MSTFLYSWFNRINLSHIWTTQPQVAWFIQFPRFFRTEPEIPAKIWCNLWLPHRESAFKCLIFSDSLFYYDRRVHLSYIFWVFWSSSKVNKILISYIFLKIKIVQCQHGAKFNALCSFKGWMIWLLYHWKIFRSWVTSSYSHRQKCGS